MLNVLNQLKKTIGWKNPGVGEGKYSTKEKGPKKRKLRFGEPISA